MFYAKYNRNSSKMSMMDTSINYHQAGGTPQGLAFFECVGQVNRPHLVSLYEHTHFFFKALEYCAYYLHNYFG